MQSERCPGTRSSRTSWRGHGGVGRRPIRGLLLTIIRLLTILTIGLAIASVLVWILASIVHGSLGRQGVAPLVSRHDGIAVLVILGRAIGASVHWPGPVRVHGTSLTKVNRLRLAPGPPGCVRLLRRQLRMVGRVTRDVKWLRVHWVERLLLLLWR